MVAKVLLAVLGLFHLADGLVMLVAPDTWAASVVHLGAADHLHHHFITDIALAFVASGAGMLLGLRRGAAYGAFALAGAIWPLLHGLFHVEEWIAMGPPAATGDLINEGIGVILAGALGIWAGWARFREGEHNAQVVPAPLHP